MMDEQSRKVPLSMSMDLALLRRLDALRGQTTRSAFVRSIITEYVDAREPQVKGQRKLTDKPGDPTGAGSPGRPTAAGPSSSPQA